MGLTKRALAAAGVVLALATSRACVRNVAWENACYYASRNLEKIATEQEEIFGIEHKGIPKLEFVDAGKDDIIGAYRVRKDKGDGTIEIYKEFFTTPGYDFLNTLVRLFSLGSHYDVRETLHHELAHHYVYALNVRLGEKGWYFAGDYDRWDDRRKVGIKLVNEGIATYFELKASGQRPLHTHDLQLLYYELDLSSNSGETKFYTGGYQLVKPVIDRFGRGGIERLVRDPPDTYAELRNLKEYVDNAMRSLEGEP